MWVYSESRTIGRILANDQPKMPRTNDQTYRCGFKFRPARNMKPVKKTFISISTRITASTLIVYLRIFKIASKKFCIILPLLHILSIYLIDLVFRYRLQNADTVTFILWKFKRWPFTGRRSCLQVNKETVRVRYSARKENP